MCVVILVPLALVSIPPLLDYPNHLARLWLIAGGANIPSLSQYYVVNWHGQTTNIGIDLAAALFGHIIPPFTLGRILLALSALLPPLGCALLSRTLHGRWTPWAGAGFLLWPSMLMLGGFLNMQIGLGLALCAAALEPWLLTQRCARQYLCHIVLGGVMLCFHPFALMFYFLLITAIAIGKHPLRLRDLAGRLWHALAYSWISLLPIALYFLRTDTPLKGEGNNNFVYTSLLSRISSLLSPFLTYNTTVDLVFFIFVAAIFIRQRSILRHQLHAGLMLVAGLLTVLSLGMPFVAFGSSWMIYRLPPMLFYTLICASSPAASVPGDGRKNARILIWLTIAIVLRTAWIGGVWLYSQPMITAFTRTAQSIPSGSRVLPVIANTIEANTRTGRLLNNSELTYRHFPALLVPWRHAFDPMLFTQKKVHPLVTTPSADKLTRHGGGLLPAIPALTRPELLSDDQSYVLNWRRKFDYILVLDADSPDKNMMGQLPPGLRLVRDDGFTRLYKIILRNGPSGQQNSLSHRRHQLSQRTGHHPTGA